MSAIDVLNFTFLGFSIGGLSKFALIIIMVSMGLSLKLSDFSVLAKKPKPVLLGLFGQIVLLPVVGFLITIVFVLDPAIAIGVIIIASCPGGATSNFMTYLSRGDVALSIVLTALSGVMAVFTVPYVINYGLSMHGLAEQGIRLPVLQTIWNIFVLTALPVIVGMVVRRTGPGLAAGISRLTTPLSFGFLLLIMFLIGREVWPNLWSMLRASFLPVIVLNAVMVLVGIGLGRAVRMSARTQRTLGIEIGFQNYTLGVVIALVLLKDPEMSVAPIIYLFSMYFTAALVVWWGRALPE
ncbi:MAG: bile acid:sodium symporter family protein [Proteobacteria bacterium]|nr:bile acid:sodium symporter family protein [Pseudomonadota bacterium]